MIYYAAIARGGYDAAVGGCLDVISPRNLYKKAAIDTRERQSWILFDLGDQAFATVILGVILPIYFIDVTGGTSTLWSFVLAIGFAIIGLSAPVLGALADYLEKSRLFLAIFTATGIIGTALMFFLPWLTLPQPIVIPLVGYEIWNTELLMLAILIIIANVGYRGARLFYNSLLPGITTEDTIDRVSAAGFAAGYLGGTFILILAFALTLNPSMFGLADGAAAARMALFVAAVWWAIFVIPLFLYVPEPPRDEEDKPQGKPIRSSFSRLHDTYRDVRKFKMAFVFLVAFWFYINGVNAIISLAAAYATDIGIEQAAVMGALLMVQILGVPFALLFGQLADFLTTKKAIYTGLIVYIGISIAAVGVSNALHFYALAFFVGLVQGGTQSISRSLFGSLIPEHKSSEFFSFYTIVAGSAYIAGPAVFGVVSYLTNARVAIGSISIFFIIGTLLLTLVDVDHGRSVARKNTPGDPSDSTDMAAPPAN